VASGEEGQLAVEDVYIPDAMGFHVREGGRGELADEVWRSPERRKQIFDYCPELSLIMDMKLERERCENDNLDGTLKEIPAPNPAPAPEEEGSGGGGTTATTTAAAEGGGGGGAGPIPARHHV